MLVRGVEPDGPAANAGVAEGDLLVALGDSALDSLEVLHNALGAARETLTLTVVRGTDERVVTVTFTK